MVYEDNNKLIQINGSEKVRIEAFGRNSFRVKITRLSAFQEEDWALIPQEDTPEPEIYISEAKRNTENGEGDEKENIQKVNTVNDRIRGTARIINGKIRAEVTEAGKLVFRNQREELLLAEYEPNRRSSLGIRSRELKSLFGGNFRAGMKFESDPKEKLYGMGQYQNGIFDLKGSFLELAQRNSQASVPFVYSSLGYGFFWNNPGIGRASFGLNMTEWEAESTKEIDFWITAGDSPEEVLQQYMKVTGTPPMMPEYGLGFWQCKLRYQTQEELLDAAREYHRRGIHLDMIIADFFHWTLEGTWAFDKKFWPDPEAMVRELDEMGTRLMVSVWPTAAVDAPDYEYMEERGYLVQTESGVKISMLMIDPTSFVDMTNPEARKFVWSRLKKNYYDLGIRDFWLDVAEPEYSGYDFENYRYYQGSVLETGNMYPVWYTRMIYDGLKEAGEKDIVSLVRCAWAGSQKYGALVWSGDIPSTFESFRKQIICGLQMAMSGIPWWTTDIGGFHGGDIRDPEFQELLIRWFQYGAFCPVMRLHGNRLPGKEPLGGEGGGRCASGAANEIWSCGEENYRIMKKYIEIREQMRPLTRKLMKEASESGAPVIRPLFYHFPDDPNVWTICDQYLFGSELLIAPVTEYGQRERMVYLPQGAEWTEVRSGQRYQGGQTVKAEAPLDVIPVFKRMDNRSCTAKQQVKEEDEWNLHQKEDF